MTKKYLIGATFIYVWDGSEKFNKTGGSIIFPPVLLSLGGMIGDSAYRQMRHAALYVLHRYSYNGIILQKNFPEAHMNMSPFLSINHSCNEALQLTNKHLMNAGLHPVQTFDLHTARLGLHDCSCPHHGTEECDCQMVVMLVYGKSEEPVTLILHGNDGQTWLSIAKAPRQRSDIKLFTEIKQALEKESAFISQAG